MIHPKAIPSAMLRCISPADRAPIGKAANTESESFALNEAQTERELQNQIEQYLRTKDVRAIFRSRMDRKTTGVVGQPDFLFTYRGRPVALECKLPGRHMSPAQIEVMHDMDKDGWFVRTVYSLDDVIAALRGVE